VILHEDARDDGVMRMLARLPGAQPDAARADRTRVRCLALAARRAEQARRRQSARRSLGPAVAGGVWLVYLAAMLFDVARWKAMF
jgi:hypothetical protein